jgi:rhodanese-related sulfurtransferase
MRNKFLFLMLALVTVAILISCKKNSTVANSNQTKTQLGPETTYADGARRITIEELEGLMKNNEVYLIDVRSQAAYDVGHLPGSRLIPAGEILNHVNELPRDKMIVTYCSWQNEHTSAGAVVALKTKGINNAAALLGGYNLWQQEGKSILKK